MQFTQIQNEIIDTAHSEGQIDPATFARLMLYEPDDVRTVIGELVSQGLVAAAEGDNFHLTEQGEAVHQAQGKARRADVISDTGSWQRR